MGMYQFSFIGSHMHVKYLLGQGNFVFDFNFIQILSVARARQTPGKP